MPEISSIWWGLLLLGLFAGVLSGMLGLGSGTMLIPVMALLLHLPWKSAQGTALAVMVPMALWGAFLYWRNPDIQMSLPIIALLVPTALVGSLIGVHLAGRVPAHVLKRIFAVFLLIVALKLLIFPGASKRSEAKEPTSGPSAALIQKENVNELGLN
jgi:hypothetical protein